MIRRLFSALRYALSGLRIAWAEGMNFKIALMCAAIAITASRLLPLSRLEQAAVVLTVGGVLAAEAFNTALEELCDKFQPTEDPHIKKIKDLAAAAVLLSALAALGVGIIIFVPYLTN